MDVHLIILQKIWQDLNVQGANVARLTYPQ